MANFALVSQIFLVLMFLTPFNGSLLPLPKDQYTNFLDFWNPWGKVIKKKEWSQIKQLYEKISFPGDRGYLGMGLKTSSDL